MHDLNLDFHLHYFVSALETVIHPTNIHHQVGQSRTPGAASPRLFLKDGWGHFLPSLGEAFRLWGPAILTGPTPDIHPSFRAADCGLLGCHWTG